MSKCPTCGHVALERSLFSSEKMDWGTPKWLFAALDAVFHFDLDAAASAENALCEQYLDEAADALQEPWAYRTFCNPPYGRKVGLWFAKAYQESQVGFTSVLLVPARTDTRYWHDYVEPYAHYRNIRGRLTFEGAPASAPFPSVLVAWGPDRYMLDQVVIPWPR